MKFFIFIILLNILIFNVNGLNQTKHHKSHKVHHKHVNRANILLRSDSAGPFLLKYGLGSQIQELNASIIFRLSSNTSFHVLQNFTAYVNSNLKSIIIQLYANNQFLRTESFKITATSNNFYNNEYISDNLIITNLPETQKIEFRMGYEMNNNMFYEKIDTITLQTCFAKPEKPIDIKSSVTNQCKLELTWRSLNKKPCYYNLKLRTSDQSVNSVSSIRLTDTKYVLDKITLNKDYFYDIESLNDNSCYLIAECLTKTIGSGGVSGKISAIPKCSNGAYNINTFSLKLTVAILFIHLLLFSSK